MKIKILLFAMFLSFGTLCFAGPSDPIINYDGPYTGTVIWLVPGGGSDQLSGDIQFTYDGVQYTINFLSDMANEQCFSDHCDFWWTGGTIDISGSNGLHFDGMFTGCELFGCIEHYYNPSQIDVESSNLGRWGDGQQGYGIFNLTLSPNGQNLDFTNHPTPEPGSMVLLGSGVGLFALWKRRVFTR